MTKQSDREEAVFNYKETVLIIINSRRRINLDHSDVTCVRLAFGNENYSNGTGPNIYTRQVESMKCFLFWFDFPSGDCYEQSSFDTFGHEHFRQRPGSMLLQYIQQAYLRDIPNRYCISLFHFFSISFGTFLIRIFKKKFMQKSLLLPLRRGRQTRDYTYAGEYCWGHTEIAKRNKANYRC